MVITSEIVCRTGTVRGQAKKNNVSIPRKTGKSTIVTHGTIRVNISYHRHQGLLECQMFMHYLMPVVQFTSSSVEACPSLKVLFHKVLFVSPITVYFI